MPPTDASPNLVATSASSCFGALLASLELRPRLATEIVDAAFQLYRLHFTALVTLTTVLYAPYILIELLVTGGRALEPTSGAAPMFILTLLGWVIGSLAEAAVVLAVSNSYLRADPDVHGAVRGTLRRFGTVLIAGLLKWLAVALGLTAGFMVGALGAGILAVSTGAVGGSASSVVLPIMLGGISLLLGGAAALYLFAGYFAVPATVMLESLGARAGLRRSRELSAGFKWKVLGALGLPMLIFFAFQFVVVGLTAALPGPAILGFVLQKAMTVVVSPILAVIATLLYYDARIRKEGFDIEVMAAELGASPFAEAEPPPVAPS